MNSPRQFDGLDALFQRTLQPYADARAPEGGWRRVKAQIQQPAQSRWRRALGRLAFFKINIPALSDVSDLFPYEIRVLVLTEMLHDQRRMTRLMA